MVINMRNRNNFLFQLCQSIDLVLIAVMVMPVTYNTSWPIIYLINLNSVSTDATKVKSYPVLD